MLSFGGPDLETLHVDGYRVRVDLARAAESVTARLFGRLTLGGEEVEERLLWEGSAGPDDEAVLVARAERLKALMQAVARYFNTGGAVEDMAEAVTRLGTLPRFELPELLFVCSSAESARPPRHVFFVPSEAAIVEVVEDTHAYKKSADPGPGPPRRRRRRG